ncbi:MAG: phosphoglucomutase/phosphomannomutase family protein, partial [Candidatus Omnitrophica bacterium]|nr:phosphoglucomutase/phosphomannomutase family protein [Candidatus Omnitrophota bacterium]
METPAAKIKFGTSGWRAIIAEDFTFENVRLVAAAIGAVVRGQAAQPQVMVGYDTRFLSAQFARACAEVLAQQGISVWLAERDVPTPVIAHHIIARKLSGGVNFTASHNPPCYNGIKYSTAYGGPAPKDITQAIEEQIALFQRQGVPASARAAAAIRTFHPRPSYVAALTGLRDIAWRRRAR